MFRTLTQIIARFTTERIERDIVGNILSEEYRHRVDWIAHRLAEMADQNGLVVKSDAEAIIYQHYLCSEFAVRRYLKTLEGARIITMNSTHLTVMEKKK